MKFSKSIRWRLLLWYGLILVMLLGGFGFTAWRLEQSSHFQQIDRELQRRVSVVTNTLRAFRSPAPGKSGRVDLHLSPEDAQLFNPADPGGYYYAVWLREKDPVAQSPNAPSSLLRPEQGASSPRQNGGVREAFLFAAPVDCVLVGKFDGEDVAVQRQLGWLLVVAGSVILALGLAGGWWLASQALRPLKDISHTAARIAGGDLSRRINISNTESELGELASVLNGTFSRLDSAFAQQARFTSDAAHELRTPVALLLAQIQAVLKRTRNADEYHAALLANQEIAQRMRKLIGSLLELARFDAGHESLGRQECDLEQVAEDGMEVMSPLAEARGIVLQADLAEARSCVDPDRIGQVVINLLTNAIEYNRRNGHVVIATFSKEGRAVLTVSDDGPGISPEDLPHVFDRFFRGDPARSGSSRTGLGLAICKAIVEAHGGTLQVASTFGQGATFTMSLPGLSVPASQPALQEAHP